MKDPEFIELLNLYLDHEISRADAARLEAEVQSSPQRRRIYQEYCRMQKACLALAQTTVSASELPERNVVPFEPRRSWGFGSYAAGLAAAAACIALVFVVRHPVVHSNTDQALAAMPQNLTVAAPAPGESPSRAIARTINVTPRTPELKSVFTARALAFDSNETPAASPVTLKTSDTRFDWMNRVQVSSVTRIPAEELVFETKTPRSPDGSTFRGQGLPQAQVEMTAFQFQR